MSEHQTELRERCLPAQEIGIDPMLWMGTAIFDLQRHVGQTRLAYQSLDSLVAEHVPYFFQKDRHQTTTINCQLILMLTKYSKTLTILP